MSSILYTVLAILILSVLIVLHELGHYLMGKLLGFGIVEFSIGMGPVLFRKKGKETDFVIRAFLIGGACQFLGEDENVQNEKAFNAQAAWKRFLSTSGSADPKNCTPGVMEGLNHVKKSHQCDGHAAAGKRKTR